MKVFFKLLLATIVVLCPNYSAYAFQSPTLPYDLFIIGLDSDISTNGDDQIILMASRDISDGFQFGLTNSLLNDGQWETKDLELEYVNIKYTGGDIILKGAALRIDISSQNIDIQESGKSISDAFDISYSSNFNGDFIKSSSFYISLYNGIMTGSGSKHHLLGSTLDVLAYGITETESENIKRSKAVDNKEFLLSPQSGTIAKRIDRDNCDLCEILLLILFSDSWLNITNTYGFDLDPIIFDIRDCIQVDCSGDLQIDTVDCNKLFASSMPCDTITEYEWSQVVDGQFFPLETGTSGPIPNLLLDSKGYYQLTITCSNGCTYTSNLYYAECFQDECDFDIDITEDNCVVSVTLEGCPNPEFQWHVQTDDGTFKIADSNSPSITAEESGYYFALITGCPNCAETPSPSIYMNCGESCNCTFEFYSDLCLLYLNEENCGNYNGDLSFSPDYGMNWFFIGNNTYPYDPSYYGNGYYKYSMLNSDCDVIDTIVFINCISECEQIDLTSSFTQECNLIFNWQICESPVLEILYASDCINYTLGGADLISLNILPDGTGWAEYQAEYTTGCYKLNLTCNEECMVTSESVELDKCCTSNFTILESDCVISGINIPCTGLFTYSLYETGVLIESGESTILPSFLISKNAVYQILIECDGCTFSSNVLNANCGENCEAIPYLSITDCVLIAVVENCESPQIQWQQSINGTWENIPGETGTSFEIIIDGIYQYIVSGCDCTNEPLDSEDYESFCFEDCNCEIQFTIDSLNCKIFSTDVNCDLIISINWYVNLGGDWVFLPQFIGLNNITPEFKGVFKKEIITKDCGQIDKEVTISCIEDCAELSVLLISNECSIKVEWAGCYGNSSYEWTFTPDCANGGTPGSADYEIILETGSSLSGEGSMEILPLDDGCFTFTIYCNDNCEESISTEYLQCCSPHATIVYANEGDELCDYCFVNACTDSLLEIYVVIDEEVVSLSIYDEFNFPYCDNGNANQQCDYTDCGNLPTFATLVNDINTWFANYGYEGAAEQGNADGTCKGIFSPLFISQSNIEFINAYIWETPGFSTTIINGVTYEIYGGGYQISPFLQNNCNGVDGEPSLKVIGACSGASFLWSTNETSQSIPYTSGINYSVTITCPDGCTTTLIYYPPLTISSHDKIVAEPIKNVLTLIEDLDKFSFKAYPNPALARFEISFYSADQTNTVLFIYNTNGQIVDKVSVHPIIGNNTKTISTDKLNSGLYILKLVGEDNQVGFQKIVIVK